MADNVNVKHDNSVKGATDATKKRNKAFAERFQINLTKAENGELKLAKQNLIYSAKGLSIPSYKGGNAWDLNKYSFYDADQVSDTIHPSLWLNGKSSYEAGVFEVVKDAIYQVRGLDLSNLTIIRSENGWIVQDVMTCVETAAKALELLSNALNEDIKSNIKAVIISHSHWDHFGGIKGVVDEENVGSYESGKIPIYVPQNFDEECVKEYIFAGTAMDRRNDYQFARGVEAGETGVVSGGLGIDHPKGTPSFITPTNRISENGVVVIDGLEVHFQLTPGTEAPAEMNNYFPKYRALWIAENCCGTLHNLYPIRGAQLRDSSGWSDYILEAIKLFGDKTDVVFQSHHWPHYNTEEEPDGVVKFLRNSAAIYRFTHDQTLHLANKGYTAKEIAKKLEIPDGLAKNWYTRPYYGTHEVNIRAVFTKYLGFYNANPAELDPLDEVEEAKTFVKYAGGADSILSKAFVEYDNGNYKEVVYAVSRLVFAEPDNKDAAYLLADAFEQLAYQSESSIWRNAYLQGTHELRNGVEDRSKAEVKNRDLLIRMNPAAILKYIGIAVDGQKAADKDKKYRFVFTGDSENDTETFLVHLYHGTLLSYPNKADDLDDVVTVKANKEAFFGLVEGGLEKNKEAYETDDYNALTELSDVLENLAEFGSFAIIEP